MKKRNLLTTAFIAALGVGVAVGVSAKSEAKAVKADAENTWMVRFQLDLGSCSPSDPDSDLPEEDKVDSVQFHCWGQNLDSFYNAPHLFYNVFDHYGVNVALNDGQIIEGAQWVLHQKSSGTKYSVNVEGFGSNEVTYLNNENSTNIFVIEYQCQYFNTWYEDEKWTFTNSVGHSASEITADIGVGDDTIHYNFEKEPASNIFSIKNVSAPYDAMSFDTGTSSVVLGSGGFDMLDEASMSYVEDAGQHNWFWILEGTYDFILENEHFAIRKPGDPVSTSIYYVLENNTPTNDYIYTWGGSEQFGSWSGTKITEVPGVEEVTGNGVLHFEGSETPKLIYKIPVKIGYPNGDLYFKFNNNDTMETETRLLVGGAAYWWSGPTNEDAGAAITFLEMVEEVRNASTDTSVCNISESMAKGFVDEYNGFSDEVRDYIDRSSVYTYNPYGEGNTLVSYRKVMEELARIANVPLVGSSAYYNDLSNAANSNILIAVIVSIFATSAVALGTLIILKKKRQK